MMGSPVSVPMRYSILDDYHTLRTQPDGPPASGARLLGLQRLEAGRGCWRAVPAAAGGYRSEPLPPRICRFHPGGPGLAGPELGRAGAGAVRAPARISDRSGPAGGTGAGIPMLL